ncbi:hypothetical protein [Sphaerisporangium melleum]|uniref:hypothetical protein n=1 Tax=Sphaerisporangium melleum TaxID=321316 RepID=UPI00166C74AD|nr:hypothetical protein [Sphaerisporangium melleum]
MEAIESGTATAWAAAADGRTTAEMERSTDAAENSETRRTRVRRRMSKLTPGVIPRTAFAQTFSPLGVLDKLT